MNGDSGHHCEPSLTVPQQVHLAHASRSPTGIQLTLGAIEFTEEAQVVTESAKPLISVALTDDAARRLHDWIEQLTRTGDEHD
jgi:hypothetical protein